MNDAHASPHDLRRRARPVDVSARMRTGGYAWQYRLAGGRLAVDDSATLRAGGYGTPELTCDWLRARGTLVQEAAKLARKAGRLAPGKSTATTTTTSCSTPRSGSTGEGAASSPTV